MALVVRPDGDVQSMTYRDPNPARSLGKIAESGAALAKFCASDAACDKYIVSAIAKTEPYLSPRLEARRAAELYLTGRTPDDLARLRAEILGTTKDDLNRFAETLTQLAKDPSICVVGGKKPLADCKLPHTESITEETN